MIRLLESSFFFSLLPKYFTKMGSPDYFESVVKTVKSRLVIRSLAVQDLVIYRLVPQMDFQAENIEWHINTITAIT